MNDFEATVESIAMTEAERLSLKAEFDWFNEQAEQDSFDRMIQINTPGCCRNGRCSG